MSGLSRTPGKRVWVHSPPRVRIPPVPPQTMQKRALGRVFHFRMPFSRPFLIRWTHHISPSSAKLSTFVRVTIM